MIKSVTTRQQAPFLSCFIENVKKDKIVYSIESCINNLTFYSGDF